MSRYRNDEANPDGRGEPETAELLAWLDGELTAQRRLEVSEAIETSARVRASLDELRQESALHSELSRNELPPSIPGVEDALRDFGSRLQREHESHAAAEAALRIEVVPDRRFFHSGWFRVAACVLLSAGIALYWLGRGPLTHVLAHNVIDRAESTEKRSYSEIAAPVVHQRMRVSRRETRAASDNAASWELWSRVDGPEIREEFSPISPGGADPISTAAPVVSEVKEVFRSNHIDSRHPLSSSAYSNWRRANSIEDVVKPMRLGNGDLAFAITSTAVEHSTQDSLLETEFTVRMSDWHIVSGRMKARTAGEIRHYDLTETSYEIVSLRTLPADVFEKSLPVVSDSAPASAPEAATPLPTLSPESAPANIPSVRDARSEIFAAAIETQYALHKLDACTEEQLTVTLTNDGQVVVQGSVLDQKRWQQIADSLSGLRAKPLLRISILTGAAPSKTPSGNTSVSAADHALIHATALYLISDGKYTSDVDTLPQDSRWLMEIMVRDHLQAIAGSLAELRRSAALTSATGVSSVSDSSSSWPAGVTSLLQDIRTLDALLHDGSREIHAVNECSG